MAYEIGGLDITLKSSGSMASYQYHAVLASTSNAADGATVVATRGSRATGVWQDNSTETTYGRVKVLGVSKMAAGDSSAMENAINFGNIVVCSSVGQAVPSTDTRLAQLGFALGSLSTGSTGIIAVLVIPGATSTA